MEGKVLYKELSYSVNGVLFEAHNTLGRFANEKQYTDLLETLFQKACLKYKREVVLPPAFEGESPGRNRIDFIVEDCIIIEAKAKSVLERNDYDQLLRYLYSANKKLGLLVNFREKHLRIHRVINSQSNNLSQDWHIRSFASFENSSPHSHIRTFVKFVNSSTMQIKIKRIDTTLPLPEYHTVGAAAFDFYSRENITIAPHALALIPSNFIIATPAGYMLTVTLRSSTPRKKGLLIPHGFGIIDQDYCGPNDEIKIQVYNYTHEAVTIERGERIAQGCFIHINRAEWNELSDVAAADRGGFGSTG